MQSKFGLVEKVFNVTLEHGEGPIWDDQNNRFYWVDLLKGDLYSGELAKEVFVKYNIGQSLGAIGLSKSDKLILAVENGFGNLSLNSEKLNLINPVKEILDPNVRFNDGIMGPDGCFYAGTMQWDGEDGFGKLYRHNVDGKNEVLLENHTIPNGMGWNNNKDTFFMIDTNHHCMYAYTYNQKTKSLSDRKIFKKFESDEYADGMAIDANDHFWIAMWGGSKIIHLDEKSNLVEEISLPVKYPTSCCFGGINLDILFITSSRLLLSESEKAKDNLAGSCFMISTNTKGKKEFRFG